MKAVLKPLEPREAVAALLARGSRLDPSFSWMDAWQEEHARMFTVAKSAGYDILADIHAELVKALREGRTFQQFAADLRPTLERKGWWGRKLVLDPETGETKAVTLGSTRRLQNIFDINMRVSYAAGHWGMFERNKATRPFLRYVHIDPHLHQPNSRPHHARLHNLVLPVDHPFWEHFAPPNGWGCRCSLQQLSQRDVDRLVRQGEELFFEPPTITTRPWTNRRTGEILHVPDGIDPGWDYNPGKTGYEATEAALDEKLRKGLFEDLPREWPPAPASEPEAQRLANLIADGQADWERGLTSAELGAFADYKASGYAYINAKLRGDETLLEEMDEVDHQVVDLTTRTLSGALERASFPQTVRLFRGILDRDADRYRNLKPGDVVFDPAFVSSSLWDGIAQRFGSFVFEVRLRQGTKAVALIHFIPDINHVEYEVLLPPAARMRVVEVLANRIVVEVIS